jgi:D-proline reductase (dithiol) PrdB
VAVTTQPDEGPVDYIEVTQGLYQHLGYDAYRWTYNAEAVPLTPLPKPLPECRVALIASGGIYRVGQVAFTHKDDTSVRRIATDVDMAELRASHFAYDLTDARRDPNVVFPLEPLRQLVADGTIGSLTSHALTFMGGIYSQRRVTAELVPQIERELDTMAADVALLVPV